MACGKKLDSLSYRYAAFGTSIGVVIFDQFFKNWARNSLSGIDTRPVIPGFFHLTYVENTGAAFGLFQGHSTALTVVVSIITLALGYVLFGGRIQDPFLMFSLSLVLGGGAGNLIDRLQHGFVIDYLDFSALFGFPVFNLADICVVIGTFCVVYYVLFLEKKQKHKVVSCGCGERGCEAQEAANKREEQ